MNGNRTRLFFQSHEQNSGRVGHFEELLLQHGISIIPGSDLEEVCSSTYAVHHLFSNHEAINNDVDYRPMWRNNLGLNDLAQRIILVKDNPNFHRLIPHLRLLNQAPQLHSVPAVRSNDNSNKLFELYVSLLCMTFSDDVELDNPVASKGVNPDIIFHMNKCRFGLACKVSYGSNPKTLADRFFDGVEQINRANVDGGIVVINIKI